MEFLEGGGAGGIRGDFHSFGATINYQLLSLLLNEEAINKHLQFYIKGTAGGYYLNVSEQYEPNGGGFNCFIGGGLTFNILKWLGEY